MFAQLEAGRFAAGELVDAVREEEFSLRVDEIPFAVVLQGAEAAGRLERRAVRPAAEPVQPGDGGVGGEVALFRFERRGKLRVAVGFAVPLLMFVLPVDIDCGVEGFRAPDCVGDAFPGLLKPDVADREFQVARRGVFEQHDVGDLLHVEVVCAARPSNGFSTPSKTTSSGAMPSR